MKDLFSGHAADYSRFRPTYSEAFFSYLKSLLPKDAVAWDCATGNGQVAKHLVSFCKEIHATDISENQLRSAFQDPKIIYSKQPAESTNFSTNFFDLIIVGQAIHWFDFEQFYREVKRVAKNGALLVLTGYGNVFVNADIDALLLNLYEGTLAGCWEPERRYIDEEYKTLPFPFEEISNPEFIMEHFWNAEQFLGYLNTWSAIKKFELNNAYNPLTNFRKDLIHFWPENEFIKVSFKQLLRIGKIEF